MLADEQIIQIFCYALNISKEELEENSQKDQQLIDLIEIKIQQLRALQLPAAVLNLGD